MKINKNRIDLLLAEQGITCKTLAERCGISRQNISTIRTRGTCSAASAAKIAKGLGVDVAEIIQQEV